MSDPPDDAPQPGPDLRKPDVGPWAAPAVNAPEPPAAPAEPAPASIWHTLDGSVPVREPTPSQFTKPPARPLEFPGLAPPRAGAGLPGAPPPTADGREVLVLASWGARLGAWLLDNILVGFVVLAFTIPAATAMGMTFDEAVSFLSSAQVPAGVSGSKDKFYALLAIQTLAQPTILALLLVLWKGQTPGKRALRLRVMQESGAPMTFRIAVRREVLGKTILIVVTFGLAAVPNYLWPLWDDQNRAGHDFLAKTRVVVDQTPR